jgi:hypothetical protein
VAKQPFAPFLPLINGDPAQRTSNSWEEMIKKKLIQFKNRLISVKFVAAFIIRNKKKKRIEQSSVIRYFRTNYVKYLQWK